MRSYIEFGALPRNLICFWAILLILCYLSVLVWSVREKRFAYAAVGISAAAVLYFMMQICRNISCWYMGDRLHPLAEILGGLPFAAYPAILTVLTLALIILIRSVAGYSRTHITPSSLKEAVDQNPEGICYYRDDGQTILTNHRMHALAFAVTGRGLLNGTELYDAVRDRRILELQDGCVVRFTHRELSFEGEPCHELLADDITELYRKSETLQKENERLKSLNRRMKADGERIDETVRHREILNTKTKIHDEMNRLLLSTDNAIRGGTEAEKQEILKTWQQNVLLLCIGADSETRRNVISDLEALAKVIGVSVVYNSPIRTEGKEVLYLFSKAVEEAMVNAAKHGGAKHLYVHIDEDDASLKLIFSDDGRELQRRPAEGGGLSSLRQRIERAGGSMQILTDTHFTLKIMIPKGDENYVL